MTGPVSEILSNTYTTSASWRTPLWASARAKTFLTVSLGSARWYRAPRRSASRVPVPHGVVGHAQEAGCLLDRHQVLSSCHAGPPLRLALLANRHVTKSPAGREVGARLPTEQGGPEPLLGPHGRNERFVVRPRAIRGPIFSHNSRVFACFDQRSGAFRVS